MTGPENRKLSFTVTPEEGNSERYGITWMTDVLELFAAADHGSTMGYERGADGKVDAILDGQGDALRQWGIASLQEGILQFTADAMSISNKLKCDDIYAYSKPFMQDFARHLHAGLPCPEIAECLGTFPFSPEQEGDKVQQTAPILSPRQALQFILRNSARRKLVSLWPQGSAVRSGWPVTWMLHPRVRGVFDILFLRELRYLSVILPVPVLKTLKRIIPSGVMRFVEYRVHGRLVASAEKHPS